MKLKTIVASVAVFSLFSLPAMAASPGSVSQFPALEHGVNSEIILDGTHPKKFGVSVSEAATLNISSDDYPGVLGPIGPTRVTLLNNQGESVAKYSGPYRSLDMNVKVQPGDYILEVSGNPMRPNREGLSDRFYLDVSIR